LNVINRGARSPKQLQARGLGLAYQLERYLGDIDFARAQHCEARRLVGHTSQDDRPELARPLPVRGYGLECNGLLAPVLDEPLGPRADRLDGGVPSLPTTDLAL